MLRNVKVVKTEKFFREELQVTFPEVWVVEDETGERWLIASGKVTKNEAIKIAEDYGFIVDLN